MRYIGTEYEDFDDGNELAAFEELEDSPGRPFTEDELRSVLGSFGDTYRKKDKPVATPRNRAGYVYLLAVPNSPGLYKIGRASNPENRLRTFNVKLPFPVSFEHLIKSSDCYELETSLHRLFADQRVNGEFFTLSAADVQIIKAMSGE